MTSAGVSHSAKHTEDFVDLKHSVLSGDIKKKLLANFFLLFFSFGSWLIWLIKEREWELINVIKWSMLNPPRAVKWSVEVESKGWKN